MEVSKATGLPLLDGWENGMDLPHTITSAVTYRIRVDNLNSLPKDKRPPRNLWDKPYRLNEFLEKVYDPKGSKTEKDQEFINIDTEDVE